MKSFKASYKPSRLTVKYSLYQVLARKFREWRNDQNVRVISLASYCRPSKRGVILGYKYFFKSLFRRAIKLFMSNENGLIGFNWLHSSFYLYLTYELQQKQFTKICFSLIKIVSFKVTNFFHRSLLPNRRNWFTQRIIDPSEAFLKKTDAHVKANKSRPIMFNRPTMIWFGYKKIP